MVVEPRIMLGRFCTRTYPCIVPCQESSLPYTWDPGALVEKSCSMIRMWCVLDAEP